MGIFLRNERSRKYRSRWRELVLADFIGSCFSGVLTSVSHTSDKEIRAEDVKCLVYDRFENILVN